MSQTSQPIAWINGEYKPIAETALHVFDKGIVHGAAVTEMLRTFRHQPFRVEAHLDRLYAGIDALGFEVFVTKWELAAIVKTVVEHNAALIPTSHDLGIIVFATAGTNLTYVGLAGERAECAVCVHTFPLPFELWAEKATSGQKLVIPHVRAVPPECIDPRIKHRSRLHWVLADQEARSKVPGASALVLDLEGRITETSSGNFFAVIDGEIVTPPPERCLGGISQTLVRELAATLKIPYCERNLYPKELRFAAEAFTSSTPYCLMPVASMNEMKFKDTPGPIYQKLIAAWNDLVGLDIIGQIQQGAVERTS
jgi:branched-subunit amino acid aminotransferase/4-amino-4-deoxychorismate lyase